MPSQTTLMEPSFRTIDGLRIRVADSGGSKEPVVLLTSPWPESVYAFAPATRAAYLAPLADLGDPRALPLLHARLKAAKGIERCQLADCCRRLGSSGPIELFAKDIEAGRVLVNTLAHEPAAPFGGFKQSGIGREYGAFGLEAFLEPKAVIAAF